MVKLRITIDRKHRYYPLNIWVNPFQFDLRKGKVTSMMEGYEDYNLLIDQALAKANEIHVRYRLRNINLTHEIFQKEFTLEYDTNSFLDFFRKEALSPKNDFSLGTFTIYRTTYNKLVECFKEIKMHQVDLDMVLEFDKFLHKVEGNSLNTRTKYHGKVKKVINDAIRKEFIVSNPYKYFKLTKSKTHREFLDRESIISLQKLYDEDQYNPERKEALRAFLFSCYTSLRLSDIKKFKITDIVAKKSIRIYPQKTKRFSKYVDIPLIPAARKLLDFKNRENISSSVGPIMDMPWAIIKIDAN